MKFIFKFVFAAIVILMLCGTSSAEENATISNCSYQERVAATVTVPDAPVSYIFVSQNVVITQKSYSWDDDPRVIQATKEVQNGTVLAFCALNPLEWGAFFTNQSNCWRSG